ncbi:hypothetical protein BDR26DRAFT_318111 [Obelidium mucronatum]|nr:hypothetical protein BDR26DRAFT_318111 [Obelidium mucronatum]
MHLAVFTPLQLSNFTYSILCFFVTFTVYTLVEGKTLDAATAFSAVLLLERLTELLGWAPQLVMWVLKSKTLQLRYGVTLSTEEGTM